MLYNIWSKRIPAFPYVYSEEQDLCFEQMPSIHAHIPNEIVYEDVVLDYGPDGEEYKGKDLYRLIMDHLLHSNEIARKILDKSQEIRKKRPLDLGVKTVLLIKIQSESSARVTELCLLTVTVGCAKISKILLASTLIRPLSTNFDKESVECCL